MKTGYHVAITLHPQVIYTLNKRNGKLPNNNIIEIKRDLQIVWTERDNGWQQTLEQQNMAV